MTSEDWQNAGFGIYVHWPFCQSKCPYCDFNSHVAETIDQERWLKTYVTELERYAAVTSGRVVQSVFFGGGTPSLMEPRTVEGILDTIRRLWPQANDTEVTLEANPGSVEAGRFRGYAAAGVNRVSMGFQAMNDRDLKRLGRLHSVDEALRAFDVARNQFDRVSFDLIYARQDQTLAEWEAELHRALSLAIDHLSLYQLTIEEGTAFGDRYKRGGLKGLPEEDLAADMYELTQSVTAEHGFDCYEVSNHARDGARSRHNVLYWRYGDYIGVGPGAHGRVTIDGRRHATEAHRAPGKWLAAAEAGNADSLIEALTGPEQAQEYLLMGLRLREGIDQNRFERLSGTSLYTSVLNELDEMNLLKREKSHIFVTDQGRMVLNAILNKLLDSLE
ncbi:radical SAM family heme chaperone HemW [Pseudooceanicola sp. CBS1P-1]|uniref:Heme chaperone HemW n=1 Tax=Pseudooceanicola albus TaxID=2692189 RepID=A0A6L7FZR6_9RHOB|nr:MULTISPECIES: radical SAM family heme chaperone HemW [Pseudooceanicola]MBT9385704.1 radical SAM family heme chaperone HemW [Pseudooceanicola endophyticus]MXN16738.1 coproporphyrinogen III oxidase [Pseudooceanicola albus]